MEIGKKITELRKQNGLSQEKLAEKLDVARQTISKWELGETTPDLKQSKELSKLFKVSLDELVNNNTRDILVEKTSNTERLAGLTLKMIKVVIALIIIVPIILIVLRFAFTYSRNRNSGRLMNTSITCEIHDEAYSYEFNYYETTGLIKEAGGDSYLLNVVDIDTSDAYQALDRIDAYAKNNGGSCKRSEAKPIDEQ